MTAGFNHPCNDCSPCVPAPPKPPTNFTGYIKYRSAAVLGWKAGFPPFWEGTFVYCQIVTGVHQNIPGGADSGAEHFTVLLQGQNNPADNGLWEIIRSDPTNPATGVWTRREITGEVVVISYEDPGQGTSTVFPVFRRRVTGSATQYEIVANASLGPDGAGAIIPQSVTKAFTAVKYEQLFIGSIDATGKWIGVSATPTEHENGWHSFSTGYVGARRGHTFQDISVDAGGNTTHHRATQRQLVDSGLGLPSSFSLFPLTENAPEELDWDLNFRRDLNRWVPARFDEGTLARVGGTLMRALATYQDTDDYNFDSDPTNPASLLWRAAGSLGADVTDRNFARVICFNNDLPEHTVFPRSYYHPRRFLTWNESTTVGFGTDAAVASATRTWTFAAANGGLSRESARLLMTNYAGMDATIPVTAPPEPAHDVLTEISTLDFEIPAKPFPRFAPFSGTDIAFKLFPVSHVQSDHECTLIFKKTVNWYRKDSDNSLVTIDVVITQRIRLEGLNGDGEFHSAMLSLLGSHLPVLPNNFTTSFFWSTGEEKVFNQQSGQRGAISSPGGPGGQAIVMKGFAGFTSFAVEPQPAYCGLLDSRLIMLQAEAELCGASGAVERKWPGTLDPRDRYFPDCPTAGSIQLKYPAAPYDPYIIGLWIFT